MTSAPSPSGSTRNPGVLRRRWKLWLALVIALLAALVMWKYPSWKAQAEVGAAYGARVGCSCHFVQGRSLESCATDFEPGMELVTIERVGEEQAIRASVPILASRTAHYAGASGCLLDPE